MNTPMTRLLTSSLLALITCLAVIGCATNKNLETLESGSYRLLAVSETAKPLKLVVVMNFTPTYLTIAGQKNAWGAPIKRNTVGELVPLKRTESNQIGAFESIFLKTIKGAKITSENNGYLVFRNNDIVVAIFQPMAPDTDSNETRQ